jgi:SapC
LTNIVVLNSQTHRNLRVQGGASAALGDNQRFVQVVVREFPLLAPHYPIFFSKDSDTGLFYCGAVLGFDDGENLFLSSDAKGPDAYRPLNMQRMPFYASEAGLGIDLDSPRVGTEQGQSIFNDDGTPTAYTQSIVNALGELRGGYEMTKIFIDTLMSLKLIEPVDINVAFDDGSRRQINGLYTVNQEALRALPDDKVVELFRRGYLQLIYLMIASVKQVSVLVQKKNRRLLDA